MSIGDTIKKLRVRGSSLQMLEERGEQVVVVDDLTELIQAQKESTWSEMARRLAHEIKNPLTPIQLSAERLQRKLGGEIDEEQRALLDRYTHTIVHQVEAMKSMVNAFTDYARSPSKQPSPLALNAMVEEVAVLYQDSNPAIDIRLDLDPAIGEISADDVRLRQLMHNLLKNSVETLDGTGWIEVRSAAVEEGGSPWIRLSVEDSGGGIATEVSQTLFDPYVTTKTGGSGLGLAVVQKIVDEHGGIVRAGRGPGGGACFTVMLPWSGPADIGAAPIAPLKSGAAR